MIKIVADSGCDISKETIERKKIFIELIPLQMQIDDRVFIDDDDLDIDKYLEIMKESSTSPKTAAPSPELYAESFEEADVVFAVTISSKLSGSNNSANLGKKLAIEKDNTKIIYILDSASASAGESTIVLKLNKLIKQGLNHKEIYENINEFIKNMNTLILLEKYDNLVKNGRLSPMVAKIASMLSIKPICHAKNGEIEILEKARGYKKAVERLVEIISNKKIDFSQRILSISNVKSYDKAIEIKNAILNKVAFKETIITDTTGLCSTYADVGGVVISF